MRRVFVSHSVFGARLFARLAGSVDDQHNRSESDRGTEPLGIPARARLSWPRCHGAQYSIPGRGGTLSWDGRWHTTAGDGD